MTPGLARNRNSVCQGCGRRDPHAYEWRPASVQRELSTPAFVLRTRPYGESDRIVTFITEHHGKVAGIAKGAKNSRRRFAGTLEPFVRVRAVFQHRPHADLVFLVRCELVRS